MSETTSQLNQEASAMDPVLIPCPSCGGQLRAEYKAEWRAVAEACALFGVTEAQLREAGAELDSFGRVRSAVPWVTCMACGLHADASREVVIIE